MGNTKINLTLTVDQINGVLEALGNMPFARVVDLVADIRNQAMNQVQPAAAPVAETVSE